MEGTEPAGLPPAHIGVHTGPVVEQDGDHFGRTVNLVSRVAGRAGHGQVLVTDEAVEASSPDGVAHREVGPVELKGLARPVRLHEASRA